MVSLFAARQLSPPHLAGATVTVCKSRSPRWPVQHDVRRVPLHPAAADHAARLVQWLRAAGAVTGDDAAPVVSSETLRLRGTSDVWEQVERCLADVREAMGRRCSEQIHGDYRCSIWAYYAAVRCTAKQPHPDVTVLQVEYLETASDVSAIEADVVADYCAEVRAQYHRVVETLRRVFANTVMSTGVDSGPWPLWDKSALWLQLCFWQWLYHATETTGRSQDEVLADAGVQVVKPTRYRWRRQLERIFGEEALRRLPEPDIDIRLVVEALQRSGIRN